ncbi:divergent polysaccharide deacetylase family protein [Roseovarius sp. A21]|uniref:Divergent polysaccharide deacetylase family protein n=2 Tax=Roseovarius bejariae TaxID=2576383 RepID=A0A844CUE9_9RHOB|nr:divergent polysaccharide deacetylase family protein [Roseovarius bejariae]MRU17045.1 divergent polysaccharide deacetylase family protein [Roseovarius bejariae]
MSEVPGAAPPEATALDVPAGSEFDPSREDREAELPEVEKTPEAGEAPKVSAPEPDDLSSLEGADTSPAAQPEAGAAEGTLPAPEAGDDSSGVAVDSDSPVLPSPQSMAPEAPAGEEDLSISTDPAQPQQPEAEGSAFPSKDEGAATEDTAEDPMQEEGDLSEDGAEAEDGTSEGTIGDMAEGVTTNRLPAVGQDAPEEDAPDEMAPAAQDLPPLEQFAAEFENPEGKPLMSIVLIDDGSSPIGFDALSSFPYPLSFAVDADWPGAKAAAAKYRAAGFEVLAMADLPEGAAAADTEVAMQAYLEAVPEAVAILEGTESGLQSSREAAEQLAPILLDSGHGIVMHPKGLNTAQKLLSREGVKAATVFRDFDAKGQEATVIRRFLDQAAFKAGQEEGGVIMLGRMRAETVSALLLWGLQDRASRVALAPVSAVLRAE